jgi:lipoprotein
MKKIIFLFLISCSVVSCQYNWPITAGYIITSDIPMPDSCDTKFGVLIYKNDYTEYIAGSIKHVYYNDKIIVAQQDSPAQPTWHIIQPREYDYLNGAWDDRIIGPVSTEQRDSVLRKANIRMQDLRHNDYTTWRFPKD